MVARRHLMSQRVASKQKGIIGRESKTLISWGAMSRLSTKYRYTLDEERALMREARRQQSFPSLQPSL